MTGFRALVRSRVVVETWTMEQMTDCEIEAIVSQWLQEIKEEGDLEEDSYSGKRSEPRWQPWCESMELNIDGEVVLARGENLSVRGIGFTCKKEVRRGAVLQIRRTDETTWVPIRIQHCTQAIGLYKVGALFSPSG